MKRVAIAASVCLAASIAASFAFSAAAGSVLHVNNGDVIIGRKGTRCVMTNRDTQVNCLVTSGRYYVSVSPQFVIVTPIHRPKNIIFIRDNSR